MKYHIVCDNLMSTLEQTINRLLLDGWKLRGDLIIKHGVIGSYSDYYYQVMTKEDEDEA